jgi:hypothetical protein
MYLIMLFSWWGHPINQQSDVCVVQCLVFSNSCRLCGDGSKIILVPDMLVGVTTFSLRKKQALSFDKKMQKWRIIMV